MEADFDFSGYVTKAGLKCTDGRTIMPDAFKHQDTITVPLVWQHGHTDPENVLGHVKLENRADGVYGYAYFNKSGKAVHAKELVQHKDIKAMSIWANELVERSKRVFHGAIREVSLVMAGANPGALIENIRISHGDGDETTLEDEVIITIGPNIDLDIQHAAGDGGSDPTIGDIFNSMTEEQKQVVYYMIGEALGGDEDDSAAQSALGDDGEIDPATLNEIYQSMTPRQQEVVHYMLGEALEGDDDDSVEHSGGTDDNSNAGQANGDKTADDNTTNDDTKGTSMSKYVKHNVFEDQSKDGKDGNESHVLSHDDMKTLVATAKRVGSLKHAAEEYALAHGITNIEVLFPDAKAISDVPEWIARRTEWVADLLGSVRKSPFSRIKTLSADLTFEQARAKGYIKGTMKREEFFGVASRTTTPTTIYKKQALDRDDVIDITDFDVIAWLKAEMRLMLDEELARAILIGDGRDVASADKINEGNIRPIAKDHELYTTVVNLNLDDAGSSMTEVTDAVIANRFRLKGTGQPTFYTTEFWIAKFLLLRDADGRRLYKTVAELAAELRVSNVVAVEAMLDDPDLIGIIVNPVDYVLGADRGGNVSMFDDFDIDYNKMKYLIETRCSGALVKVKAAMVLRKVAANITIISPNKPAFNGTAITITDQVGVQYRNQATGAIMTAAGSPYAVADGTTTTVVATPTAGFAFATSDDDTWAFYNPAG